MSVDDSVASPQVLMLTALYPTEANPAQGTFVRAQSAALRRAGVSLEVAAPLPWAPWPMTLHPRWSRYRRPAELPGASQPPRRSSYFRPPGSWFQPLAGASMARAVGRSAVASSCKLLHGQALLPAGSAVRHLSARYDVPYVLTVHGSDVFVDPRRSARHMKECRRVARGAAEVMAVSRALGEAVESFADREVTVVPNGVDLELFQPLEAQPARRSLGVDEEAPLLLFVGLDPERKGLRFLLRAVEHLRSRDIDVRLAVVGPSAETIARHGEIGDHVLTPGMIDQEEVAVWTAAADVVVLPSLEEAFGCSLVEAGACARPVVASRVDGIIEVVDHQETGLLVRPGSSEEIAAAIERLVSDPRAAAAMGRRARSKMEESFSWERNAENTAAIYERVLAGKGSGCESSSTARERRSS